MSKQQLINLAAAIACPALLLVAVLSLSALISAGDPPVAESAPSGSTVSADPAEASRPALIWIASRN